MSDDRREEYLRELMGEDFTLAPNGGPPPEEPARPPEPKPEPKPAPEPEPGQKPHEDPSEADIGPDLLPIFDDDPEERDYTVEFDSPEEPTRRWSEPEPEPEPEPRKSASLRDMDPKRATPRRRGGERKSDPVEDFEVEFDFDKEYADVEEKVVRRGRTKRTGCLSGLMMFLFIMCVSVVLASLGWVWATDVLGLDGDDVPVEVVLPKSLFHTERRERETEEGETEYYETDVADIDAVADRLVNSGLVRYKWLFKLFCSFAHADEKIMAGTYTLNMNYDYRALIHGMNPVTGVRETIMLTIPEGYSITQIVDMMVENEVCERDELLDVLKDHEFDYDFLENTALGDPKHLEGFLFPDTYEFYIDDDPVDVVERFLDNFEKKWTDDLAAKAQELGYTVEEILNIAAMIEKEAGADSERDTIASVIENRLNHPDRQGTNGLLQIDATINYIIADTGQEFSTEIDSPYNTYKYPGLPKGPICNPGMASIRAAITPADTDYYYYALSTSGTHKFFETYGGFEEFVNSDQYGG